MKFKKMVSAFLLSALIAGSITTGVFAADYGTVDLATTTAVSANYDSGKATIAAEAWTNNAGETTKSRTVTWAFAAPTNKIDPFKDGDTLLGIAFYKGTGNAPKYDSNNLVKLNNGNEVWIPVTGGASGNITVTGSGNNEKRLLYLNNDSSKSIAFNSKGKSIDYTASDIDDGYLKFTVYEDSSSTGGFKVKGITLKETVNTVAQDKYKITGKSNLAKDETFTIGEYTATVVDASGNWEAEASVDEGTAAPFAAGNQLTIAKAGYNADTTSVTLPTAGTADGYKAVYTISGTINFTANTYTVSGTYSPATADTSKITVTNALSSNVSNGTFTASVVEGEELSVSFVGIAGYYSKVFTFSEAASDTKMELTKIEASDNGTKKLSVDVFNTDAYDKTAQDRANLATGEYKANGYTITVGGTANLQPNNNRMQFTTSDSIAYTPANDGTISIKAQRAGSSGTRGISITSSSADESITVSDGTNTYQNGAITWSDSSMATLTFSVKKGNTYTIKPTGDGGSNFEYVEYVGALTTTKNTIGTVGTLVVDADSNTAYFVADKEISDLTAQDKLTVTINGKKFETETVYKSVKAGNETIEAADGHYLYGIKVTNVTSDDQVALFTTDAITVQ